MAHQSGWIGTLTGAFNSWRLALSHFEIEYFTRIHPIRFMGSSTRFGAKGQSGWNALCRFFPQETTVAADIKVGEDVTLTLFLTAGQSWVGTASVERFRMISPIDQPFEGEALLYGQDILEFDKAGLAFVMPDTVL